MMVKERLIYFLVTIYSCLLMPGLVFSQQMEVEGDVDAQGHQIKNVAEPTQAQHLATQEYIGRKLLLLKVAYLGVQAILDEGSEPLDLLAAGVHKDSLYGKFYQGGIIFYLDDLDTLPGIKGMVVDTMDFGDARWGCAGTSVSSAVNTSIGTGWSNTSAIRSACSDVTAAAQVIYQASINGHIGWFIPSRDELFQMYETIGPGAPAPNTNTGNFLTGTTDQYVSSTQCSAVNGAYIDMSSNTMVCQSKNVYSHVRPALAF